MKKQEDGTFHGGFVRNRGEARGVRVAKAKVTELPIADAEGAQERLLEMKGTNFNGGGQSPRNARKTKLAVMGIPSHILDKGNPEYARCVRLANAFRKERTKELYIAHGYVSSGVGALLASASLAHSASRFLYELASSTEAAPEFGLGMPQLLKLASSLSDSARQNELSAWELCAREAVIRKRNDQNNVQSPWLVAPDGAEKRKPGRPRKVEPLLLEAKEKNDAGIGLGQDYEGGSESTDGPGAGGTSEEGHGD